MMIQTENMLLDNGSERAFMFKRGATINGHANPIFALGRITGGGDGDPNFRVLYSDDSTSERSVFEFDSKGIVASVKPDVGSHFEGFIGGDYEPLFRLNRYPNMGLERGPGGLVAPNARLYGKETNSFGLDVDALFIESGSEPSTDSGGGYIYVDNGALKFKGGSGTVTTIASA